MSVPEKVSREGRALQRVVRSVRGSNQNSIGAPRLSQSWKKCWSVRPCFRKGVFQAEFMRIETVDNEDQKPP